ncbi:unnamed protein product [Diplocarpon coronariae]
MRPPLPLVRLTPKPHLVPAPSLLVPRGTTRSYSHTTRVAGSTAAHWTAVPLPRHKAVYHPPPPPSYLLSTRLPASAVPSRAREHEMTDTTLRRRATQSVAAPDGRVPTSS